MIKPQFIKTSLGTNVLENDIQFISYDNSNGNVTELKGKDNVNIVYLWSYNGKYPIAEINNSTYNDVVTALAQLGITNVENQLSISTSPDMSIVNQLRQKLPNSLISTYNYKPLVGICTKTDARGITTTYNYDTFNRLKNISDTNGSIIQSFDYNYKH